MGPDDELAGVYHWVESMCVEVSPPPCTLCSEPMDLTPPELLYYTCASCYPASHEWSFVEDIPYN